MLSLIGQKNYENGLRSHLTRIWSLNIKIADQIKNNGENEFV